MFQVDDAWVTGTMVQSHGSLDELDDESDMYEDDDMVHEPPKPVANFPVGDDEAKLLASQTTLRFQARPEHFSGPARELALRCEARISELSWRAERRASLMGQQLARHEEPYHSLAGQCSPPTLAHTISICLLHAE